jgi:hypothetical protein
MAEANPKLKLTGIVIGIIVVLVILVFAALFISGMAEGTFTIFGFDRPPASYLSKYNLSQDVKPVIGTGQHSTQSVRISWNPRTDISGVIDPITSYVINPSTDMGYIITTYANGTKGNNVWIVPGINTSYYDIEYSQIASATGLPVSSITSVQFTIRTFINTAVAGNESSISGSANPNLGATRQTFMNFNKPSTNQKITNLKLHNHMHVRGPNSLKNLNTSSKEVHHGPKVGVLDYNIVQDDTYFQAPF